MRFSDSLFGVIAEGSGITGLLNRYDFLPINANGDTIDTKESARWIGLNTRDQQLKAYFYCSPLASVIDRLAEADTNGKPEILRASGKGKEDYATSEYAQRMIKLLANPNPLQSWLQFRGQQVVYKKIFGFCPVWAVNPAGFNDPSYAYQMWNIPPWLIDVEETKRLYRQSKITGIVLKWVIRVSGEQIELPADKLFILEDSFMQDEDEGFILPKSRMVGLDMSISNICAAMEAKNVLLRKKGPLGAWTHDAAATKDSVAGYIPMTDSQRKIVQADLAQYGIGWNQYQSIVTRQALKWQATSFDVKQLGIDETLTIATKEICHRYNYSYTLLEETDATFAANASKVDLRLYQNNIIPARCKDDDKYSVFFKMAENNCKLVSDFDDLPIMQVARKEAAEAMGIMTKTYLDQYKNNIITENMMLTALDYDTKPDGDRYYNETEEYAQQQQQSITGNQA